MSKNASFRKTFFTSVFLMMLVTAPTYLQDTLVQFCIGNIMGNVGLEAYGVIYPILVFMFALATFIPFGIQAMVSKSVGSGNFDDACKKISVGLSFGISILFIVSILVCIFSKELIEIQGDLSVSSEIIELATKILRSVSFSIIGFCMMQTLLATLFFNNQIKKAVFLSIESIIIQISITTLLSFGIKEPSSIGIGYSTSTMLSTINILLQIIIPKPKENTINYRNLRLNFNIREFFQIVKSGFTELLSWILFGITSLIKLNLVSNLNINGAIAGFTISNAINAIPEAVYSAMYYTLVSIIGYAYGTKDKEFYKKTSINGLKYTLITSVSISLIVLVLSYPLVIAIAEETDLVLIRITMIDLILYSVAFPFYCLAMYFHTCFIINTYFIHTYVISFIEEILAPIIVMFTLPAIIGTTGFSLSDLVSEITAIIYIFFIFKYYKRKNVEII